MLKHCALDLERADPIPRTLDDIVRAAFKPEIPLLVPPCEIAGTNPFATTEPLRRCLVVPVSQPIAAAVAGPLSDQPDRLGRQLLAHFADDCHALSGRRKPHRAGLHLHCKAIVVADRQAKFCGSEMIHRNDAPGISKEIYDFRVQGLAATRYRTNCRSAISYLFAAHHQTSQHRWRRGQVGEPVSRNGGMADFRCRIHLDAQNRHAQCQCGKVATETVAPTRIAGRPEHVIFSKSSP